jgi:pilus assembly protein CpaB
MNRRLTTILAFAGLIALACAFLVYRTMGSRLAAAKPLSTTPVVAAARDLKIGVIIAPSDLTTVSIAGPAPQGAITNPKDAIGRGVVSAVYQGEPILDGRLASKGSGGGLAATIPQGMRACAVKVDEVVGVAGFVTPGMRVDVLVSGNPPGVTAAAGTQTTTILQNIQVLSAGTDIQRDAEGKPQQVQVVNLLVTPEQAEKLSLASNQLKIQLVLRNPLDTKIAQVPTTAMSSLFSGQNVVPVAGQRFPRTHRKPARPMYSVVVVNGGSATTERFPVPGGQP